MRLPVSDDRLRMKFANYGFCVLWHALRFNRSNRGTLKAQDPLDLTDKALVKVSRTLAANGRNTAASKAKAFTVIG